MYYNQVLEDLGLSQNEAKIYETLLYIGDASVGQISKKSNIHRRNIYDAIARLEKKGLISQIIQRGENLYQAVNPDKLVEVIREKEKKLESIMPDLQNLYIKEARDDASYIYRGEEGFKNYVKEFMYASGDGLSLGAKGILHSLSKPLAQQLWEKLKRENRRMRTLYDPLVAKHLPSVIKAEGGEKKILPAGFETTGILDVFGDYVVTFANVKVGVISEHTTIFVMINQDLANSYRVWFDYLWNLTPELPPKLLD